MTAPNFRETLERLGLGQYHDGLVQEAFDSWEILADITEEDLDALGVKLGHRRILQRAIADQRKDEQHPPAPTVEVPSGITHRPVHSEGAISVAGPDHNAGSNPASRATTGNKRKYRRHPKPDDNAPDRPPSAYVLFSNQVREHLKGRDLTFTAIAKTVGERWQVLASDEKATYESRSQAMKDRYYAQLAEYKKTEAYAQYQNYLADFKAKHEPDNGKKLKESSLASPSRRSSDERAASSPDNRESSAQSSELQYSDRRPSAYNSPQLPSRPDWRPLPRSENISPDSASSGVQLDPGFSPRHSKPAFSSINAPPPSIPTHMSQSRPNGQSASPMGDHPMAVSTSMAYGYHPLFQAQSHGSNSPPNLSSRRPTLASETSLPSLRHSNSLGSSSAGSPLNTSAPNLPRGLPSRELPLPYPRPQNGAPNGVSQPLPPMKTPGSPGRFSPPTSGLATLLRAGEHLASHEHDPVVRVENGYPDSRYM